METLFGALFAFVLIGIGYKINVYYSKLKDKAFKEDLDELVAEIDKDMARLRRDDLITRVRRSSSDSNS